MSVAWFPQGAAPGPRATPHLPLGGGPTFQSPFREQKPRVSAALVCSRGRGSESSSLRQTPHLSLSISFAGLCLSSPTVKQTDFGA